ncbi:inositol-pentakisphosphate 2-kinase IPK1 isoform X1 [Dendrobium catenatum]|uniref:Inositol-pentakisphosphate 2-kinase n=1 Tax=Dendrobium catenatum TaxID=906689 RepID=A0A2I0VIA9_9ASPA|nr:inositol-pentakisphosphate 2-kinase IPK1 isoform X1 [Dendrobium catenatum]PKU63152.1 Inositol-pentakisphosphate 2-kinase [Dendrobium catenatum]
MAITLTSDDAKDWIYKGEGGANLVLGYCGSSPFLVGKVLRVHKVLRSEVQSVIERKRLFSECEQLVWGDIPQLVKSTSKEIAEQVFAVQVMSPLLDSKHIDGGVPIFVTKEFLESVEKNVHTQRPPWRLHATEVDLLSHSALLMSDHSVFSSGSLKDDVCVAVEIKPKCGFLPSSKFIAKQNAVKKSVTRFRMHQLLKFHQGEISQPSEYNPLDLLSGSREQINQAIAALFSTPYNNFRIFLNGSLIFGNLDGSDSSKNTVYSANQSGEIGASIEDQIKVLIQGEFGFRLATFIELVSEAIFRSGVLDRLLAVQKLDVFDIEGTIHVYYNLISEPCMVCKNLGDSESVQKYYWLHTLSFEESLKIVRDFLIAATAKDCSLMISFRPQQKSDSSQDFIHLESSKQTFDYKAYFIDLDMKPLDKMVHYYKLDQSIVSFYTQCGIQVNNDAVAESL